MEVEYNGKIDEVMNLGLDEDPEDQLKAFEMSREIEQAFCRYDLI